MSHELQKPGCNSLINLFPDPFVVIDRKFQIVAANKKYQEHYKQNDIIGKFCYEVSHGIDRPCSQNGEHCPLEKVIQSGKPTSVMHIHCNCDQEELVQLSASPIFDEDGNVQYMGESIQPVKDEPENEQILLGKSKSSLRLISILYRVAPTSSTVLLLGESGVGKDCAARYIHQSSNRASQNFIVVDCAALDEKIIERELFGHEKDAFPGANVRKTGLFEAANRGTLFIDEIGDLPFHLQTKLLRVLETSSICRLGGNEYINVDVRIITATNRDPQQMFKDKTFREDLYYRLCAFPVNLPSLRDRKGDIPLLAEFFLKQTKEGRAQIPLASEVIEKLLGYDYPGNIRELKNIIERALILSAGSPFLPEFIVFENKPDGFFVAEESSHYNLNTRRPGINRLAKKDVLNALQKCGGHRSKAALMLGVSERTIYRHLKN